MPDPKSSSERLEALKARWESDKGSRVFLQLADEYRRLGRLGDSVNVLEEGLESNPGHLGARVARARCLLDLGRSAEAAEELERVTEADPTQMVAYRLLVDAYLAEGDADKARQRLRVYGLLNDSDPEIEELEGRIARLEKGGAPAGAETAEPGEPTETSERPEGDRDGPGETQGLELSDDVSLPDDLPALEDEGSGEEPLVEIPEGEGEPEPFGEALSEDEPKEAAEAGRPESERGESADEPFGDILTEPAELPTADSTARLTVEDEDLEGPDESEPLPIPPAETVAFDTTEARSDPPETPDLSDESPSAGPAAPPDPFPGLTLPEPRRGASEPLEDDLFGEPAEPVSEPPGEPASTSEPVELSDEPAEASEPDVQDRVEPDEPAVEAGAAAEAEAPEEPAREADPFDLGPPPEESSAGGLEDLFGGPAPPPPPASGPEADAAPAPEEEPEPGPAFEVESAPEPEPVSGSEPAPAAVSPPAPEPAEEAGPPPETPEAEPPAASEAPPAPPASPEAPAQDAREEGRATVTLGRLYLRQGHHREAGEIFREVLERDPDNEEARRGLDEVAAREAPDLGVGELLEGFDPTAHGEGLTARKRYALERYRERIRGSGRDVH